MGTDSAGLYARPVPRGKFHRQKNAPENRDRNGAFLRPLDSLKLSGLKEMSRFFFNVRDSDGDLSRDTEGQELPDLESARAEAISANREMLGERLLHGGRLDHRQIEIADEQGKVLAKIDANDVLFRDGEYRSYSDDVTKSAPIGLKRSTGKKRATE
jgi:hypothetical protein